jgi:hypothetical protein
MFFAMGNFDWPFTKKNSNIFNAPQCAMHIVSAYKLGPLEIHKSMFHQWFMVHAGLG